MHDYVVGFKDVYPWVWSVMLGVALMLAERRGAFQSVGTNSHKEFWLKSLLAVFMNIVVPAALFALTMVRLGPRYPPDMDFWQVIGVLYLAGVPLGSHHAWLIIASRYDWIPKDELAHLNPPKYASSVWVAVSLFIPAAAAFFGWALPY